jgi:elongation factor P
MLEYNEIKPKTVIVFDEEPWEVIDSHIFRKQQRKPVNQTTLRNLMTGRTVEHSFHQSEKVHEAEVSKREVKYLYQKGAELWFCNPKDPKDRFTISRDVVGDKVKFMLPNRNYGARVFKEDVIFDLELPIKDVYEVKEAPPNIKGNTVSGSGKPVVISTGATVLTPFFIEVGEKILVNTGTGEYIERYKEGMFDKE